MKIKEISHFLEEIAPISSQESYDNSGLIIGDGDMEVSGVLISLDCIEKVVDEAIDKGCNLIISHHPIVFSGLKKLNGKNYIERTVLKAIKNDIAIYAMHTNLDNYRFGVNFEIGSRLGLKNMQILAPKKNVLSKLVVFVPKEYSEKVSKTIFEAGAGVIGNYSNCSFSSNGIGTFLPENGAIPFEGEVGKTSVVNEVRLEVLVSNHKISKVLEAMIEAHPYEEVAHEVYPVSNMNQDEGAGMIGELEEAIETSMFFRSLKEKFNCGVIRHTDFVRSKVKKIAFCGGAGSFLLESAKRKGADVFITGDFKYHEFFDAENQLVIADIGHFESEQFTSFQLATILTKKFPKFAVHLTEVNTNPINYF